MIGLFVWTLGDLVGLIILGIIAAVGVIAAICWMIQTAYRRVRRFIKRKFGR